MLRRAFQGLFDHVSEVPADFHETLPPRMHLII